MFLNGYFKIVGVFFGDGGFYICYVKNIYGDVQMIINVIVLSMVLLYLYVVIVYQKYEIKILKG